jgi:hypothetical protein
MKQYAIYLMHCLLVLGLFAGITAVIAIIRAEANNESRVEKYVTLIAPMIFIWFIGAVLLFFKRFHKR